MSRYRPDAPRPAWRRPMAGWWRRHPFYLRYMLREASALCITAYALLLLAGLVCLQRGEAAYNGWRALLDAPWSIGLHGVALVVMGDHAITWFQVLPKTLPRLPVPARWVTLGAIALSAVLSLALLVLLWWATR